MLEGPLKAADACFAFRLLHRAEVLFYGDMLLFLLDTEYREMGQVSRERRRERRKGNHKHGKFGSHGNVCI